MNWVVLLSVVVIGFVNSSFGAKSIPSYIELCKRSNPNLHKCHEKQLINVLKHLNDGIPEMNLRKIDPYLIEKLNLDFETGTSVSFNAVLNNMKLFGLTSVQPTTEMVDLDKVIFKMNLFVPDLRMESNYKAKGKVLLVQFDSEGPFWGNFTNVLCKGTWTGKKFMKKGKEHLMIEKGDVDIDIKDIKMYFSNLFPNNDEITKSTNEAINGNIDILYEEIKPLIIQTFNTVVIDATNNVFNLFPMDKLFPKD